MFSHADNRVDRWFSELGNDATESLDLDSDVLNQQISEAEVREAIGKLKTGKACGLDSVLAGMLKLGGSKVILFLVTYFNCIFNKGDYPREWAKAIIVLIHKKGNADLPDNYRGVSLLSVISKGYTLILNKTFVCLVGAEGNNKIVEEQARFRKSYSTVDHIFALNAIIQKHLEKRGAKNVRCFCGLSRSIRLSKTL